MDNRGTPPRSNSHIRISKKRKTEEAENGVDEYNQAYEEAERRRKGKMVVSGNESPKVKRKIIAKKPKLAEPDVARDAEIEYERQLNVAIRESLKSYYNNSSGRGNEIPKGKRKIKAKKPKRVKSDVARGKFINSSSDTEPMGSMPHQRVSSRVCLLKYTSKLLKLSKVVNPDGSDVGVKVGGSEPDEDYWIPDLIVVPFLDPISVAGQASEANAVGRQTDMVVPLLEPMVCVTNRNPMDFTVEEAKKYMQNRTCSTSKVC